MNEHSIEIDPASTALVIVDMQNDFCSAGGYYAQSGRDISLLSAAIAPTSALLERARDCAMTIAFTRLVHDSAHGAMEERHRLKPRRWTSYGERLLPGSWGADVVDELCPRNGEIVIDKPGYSAFEHTDLELRLRERGVRTLLFAGVVTYACVLATAFSAFDRDFDVLLVSDAVGTWAANALGPSTFEIVDLLLGSTVSAEQLVFRQVAAATR